MESEICKIYSLPPFLHSFLLLLSHISTIKTSSPKPFHFFSFSSHSQILLLLLSFFSLIIYKLKPLSFLPWLPLPFKSTSLLDPMVPPTYASPPFPFNPFSSTFPLMSHFEGCHNNNNNNSHHLHLPNFPLQDESITQQTPSTSKDLTLHDSADKGWLRLSVGGGADLHHPHPQPSGFAFGLTELDLLPGAGAGAGGSKLNESLGVGDFSPGLVLPQPPPELNWTFRPISSHNSSSSNCSSFIPFGPYFSRPFQLHPALDLVASTAAAGPSSDAVRVIDPPRRPHSGIWFSLQPLELNQGKQPALPQRSSSYLRIKDGRMTVRLLIKYLVKKLGLDSESEVEIRCRGEKLEACLTMQHIRDNIWFSKEDSPLTLLPNSSTIDHIMVLHYAIPNSPS